MVCCLGSCACVLALAESLGVTAFQGKVYPQDFRRAEESFLTNSLLGVMPLVSFNGKPVGKGGPGPLSQMLRQELQKI